MKTKNGPTPEELCAQFGVGDVEQLAMDVYNSFHGICPCGCHDEDPPWPPYSTVHPDDVVVIEFRRMAKKIADRFSDGHIGGVYYEKG